ncbi:hypothetical protein [Lentzea sp. NEAU-D7]|uniref:hypothetical protein n=1 Tax=Lentzea sp. NEAU-D7 TaxID=2994667 RepID=UPI00224B185B|nr:hypothetical protein [Lentzea sp. NEAU-D7]MCX2949954.1 hypothetical protein [Lentzea sp. NEAU-D7]
MFKNPFSKSVVEPTEPSLSERLTLADVQAGRALAQFTEAAEALESAAREQEMVAQETAAQIETLAGQAAFAEFSAAQNRASAKKLRDITR